MVLVALAVVPAANADPAASFDFASSGSLAVVPGVPTTAVLCNGTASPVTAQLSTEGFQVALALTAPAVTIGSGSCATIKVAATAGVALPGSHDGVLVAVSAAGVARRAVTILAAPAAAVVAVTDLTLAARHYPGTKHATLIGGKSIPLGPYAPGTLVRRPTGTLAVLQNGSHRADLVAVGTKPLVTQSDGFADLPVTIDGARKTGTYKGTVTFGASTATVAVAVGDPLWVCILAILAGIAFAVLAALEPQRFFPRLRLWLFRHGLDAQLTKAKDAYMQARGEQSSLPALTIDSDKVAVYTSNIKNAFKAYKRRTLLIDSESPDYKAIQKLVDDATKDVSVLASKDGLIDVLAKLNKALGDFEKRPDLGRPKFLAPAHELFHQESLGPGDATTLAQAAAAYTTLLSHWSQLWLLHAGYRSWLSDLTKEAQAADLHLLHRPEATLIEIACELVEVGSVEAFDHSRIQAHFDRAYDELSALGWIYHPSASGGTAPVERPLSAVLRTEAVAFAAPRSLQIRAATIEPQPVLQLLDAARRSVGSPDVRVAVERAAGRVAGTASSVVVIAVAAAGALSTGLATIYSGTFGSLANYLTAFGLGGVASVASKAILDGITAVRKVAP